MASRSMPQPDDSKATEAMQQSPSAPEMGPPPTYTEAMNTSPYPAMPVAVNSQSAPYPTNDTAMTLPQPIAPSSTAPYPIDDNLIAKPIPPTNAPYPIDDNAIPQPMTQVHPTMHAPLHDNNIYSQPMGFNNTHNDYQQAIVNQPGAYNDEYYHPKATYVILQDQRNRRVDDDNECSCTDWLMCCMCCLETCRCMLLCLECAATCK